jgi:hypothetical protein
MTNHMHVAGYFPRAYEGRLKLDEREYSVAEIATMREFPPILYREGDWILTTEGIDCLTHNYWIEKARFGEKDWSEHMREKNWVNQSDFANILSVGRDFVRLNII